MYSIDFMKIETHVKLSFHCSDFRPPILPASTTYTKDGANPAEACLNIRHFRHSVFRHFFYFGLILALNIHHAFKNQK